MLLLLGLAACAEASPPTPTSSPSPPPPRTTASADCTTESPAATEEAAPPPPSRFESRTIAVDDPRPRWVGRPIDVDLKDADIHNVCRLLADVGKTNIVLGDGVQGTVTLSMHRVPWDQVLDAVLQAKGLRMEREGNVILVFAK